SSQNTQPWLTHHQWQAPIIGDPASCVIWWDGDHAARTLLPQNALCTSYFRNPWRPSYSTARKNSISQYSQLRVSPHVSPFTLQLRLGGSSKRRLFKSRRLSVPFCSGFDGEKYQKHHCLGPAIKDVVRPSSGITPA